MNWVEYYIAKRSEQSSDQSNEGGVMSRIATVAVAMSIAVMIISVSIIYGFKSEVHNRLTTLSGDIIIANSGGVDPTLKLPINRCDTVESFVNPIAQNHDSEVRHVSSFATYSAVVSTDNGFEGVIVKGVDSTLNREPFIRGIIEGEVPTFSEASPHRTAMISNELATGLEIKLGDRLELITPNDESELRVDLYRVGAIYTAGLGESERKIIFVDIRNVQRINGWSNEQISGYEVRLTDYKNSLSIADQINHDIVYADSPEMDGAAAFSTEMLFPAIYNWLSTLDINAIIIITIMMIVALFNIITALLILVLERVQMVGILKAMGMCNRAISRIFLYRAMGITLRGLAWGNSAALALAFIQKHWGIIKLDESSYIIDSVAIDISFWWWATLNLMVILTILVVVTFPTHIVSTIEPHKAIKFQ